MSVNETSRSGGSGASCSDGQMNARPRTRVGCSAATSSERTAPRDSDTSTALSVPVASITASMSAANSSSRYASGPRGRSEPPLPRPSNVTTR